MPDLNEFEQSLQAEIAQFTKQQTKRQSILPTKRKPVAIATNVSSQAKGKKKPWTPKPKPKHRITLGVYKKQISINEPFVHESFCVAQLDAEIEAKKAAEEAGWQVAHVIDRERL